MTIIISHLIISLIARPCLISLQVDKDAIKFVEARTNEISRSILTDT